MESWFTKLSGHDTEVVTCEECGKQYEVEPEATYSFDTYGLEKESAVTDASEE